MSSAILEANLNALGTHNARLVQRLRATLPASDCAFAPTPQGVPSLSYQGTQLCSRHRPLEEADRFGAGVDVVEHAAIVILGFGAGYHVQRLAERLRKTSLIIVFEPDLALLRAVLEEVDHSAWIAATNLTIVDDPADRAGMSVQLAGAEGIVVQGVTIQVHPPSRGRLGPSAGTFSKTFADLVSTFRTTMLTTLVHSSTTCRNLSLNLDHYAAGQGIAELRGIAGGRTALLISAGPSLSRHYELLADPTLRERVILIAVQTCLRPLLRRGIRPHFVTAIDYHEISSQFYDGLDPEDLRDITLVCEPKVNRIVIESYPGPIRCVANNFLDRLLGSLNRDMGSVPAGSTVAHLSFYLAQYLGCDPIVLLGQDLGFTDGLYYGPGAAIHDQWAPEINPFNTIDMMEWVRVARMKRNLRASRNQSGRSILVDEQMSTYLTQFERDFSNASQTIIDAAGGGVAKQHTIVRPLDAVLAEVGATPLPEIPAERGRLDVARLKQTAQRIRSVRDEVKRLEHLSEDTAEVLAEMLAHQQNQAAMDRLFKRIKSNQKEVSQLSIAHDLVNLVNQLGVFKRLKADRQLEVAEGLDPLARQKAQLERDQTNVRWLAQACEETRQILDESLRVLSGESVNTRISERASKQAVELEIGAPDAAEDRPRRVAAIIAVDPRLGGLRLERRLDELIEERTMLQATLERMGRARRIESIVLLVPEDFDVRPLIDESAISRPVQIREVQGPLFGEAQPGIGIARRWSDWSWRGGIGGMTVYDEVLSPSLMADTMEEMNFDAAVVVGPDWPLVDWSEETGCDALVARYLEHPLSHRLVFTQAPPGLCGILIATPLMREMAQQARQFTIGSMLSYVPSLPQLDPTSKDACVKLPAAIRDHVERCVCDTPERHQRLQAIDPTATGLELAQSLATLALQETPGPQQLEIELTTRRTTQPFWSTESGPPIDASPEFVQRILRESARRPGLAVTFGGRGDPLLHPQFAEIVRAARDAGCSALHVRTDLPAQWGDATTLLDLPIDVISVDLHAETAETYRTIMGVDGFDELRERLDALANARNARGGSADALVLPWIVPRLVRCEASIDEMRNFYDRWIHYVGAAMIDAVPIASADPSIQLQPPPASIRELNRRLLQIRADGTAFVSHNPWAAPASVMTADLNEGPLADAWKVLQANLAEATAESRANRPTILLELGAA